MKKKKSTRILLGVILGLLAITLIVGGVMFFLKQKSEKEAALAAAEEAAAQQATLWEEPIPEPEPEPEPPFEEYDIKLMAVGDDLCHMGVVNSGKMEDGTYNYDHLFAGISDALEACDIKIINQETIFGGDDKEFTGYPAFNTPSAVGDALINAGFNVVLSATNHTCDMGQSGMDNAREYFKNHPEVTLCGLYLDEEKSNRIPIVEVGDFSFAILNYTYGPNMASLPGGFENYFGMLCPWDESSRMIDFTNIRQEVLDEITEAKTLADIVIVCPHWGVEYTTTPTQYQTDWAVQMANAGADVIIGAHPHVPEPVELIQAEDGHECLCYYSLGNYVSTQQHDITMLEEMAWVDFHVTEEGISLDPELSGVIPMVAHYTYGPLRFRNVYYLADYTDELAAQHGINGWGDGPLNMEKMHEYATTIMGEWILEHPPVNGES